MAFHAQTCWLIPSQTCTTWHVVTHCIYHKLTDMCGHMPGAHHEQGCHGQAAAVHGEKGSVQPRDTLLKLTSEAAPNQLVWKPAES